MRKPSIEAFMDKHGWLVGILLLPVLCVVIVVAQVVELLYYLCLGTFYTITGPYWIGRALWFAFGPASTPEELARRARFREHLKASMGCLGITVLGLAILAGIVAAIVMSSGG